MCVYSDTLVLFVGESTKKPWLCCTHEIDRLQTDAPSDAPTAMPSVDPLDQSSPLLSRRGVLVEWVAYPTLPNDSSSSRQPCFRLQPA